MTTYSPASGPANQNLHSGELFLLTALVVVIALGPFALSVGYLGLSLGWQDIHSQVVLPLGITRTQE